jgi:plastocyanin
MKKLYVLLIALTLFSLTTNATVHVVNVADFSFSPSNLPVVVGDTIRWQWVNGSHTTTSTSVPVGAPTWDSPISSVNPVFDYIVTLTGSYTYKCTPHFPGMTGSFTASAVSVPEFSSAQSFQWNITDNQLTVSLNLSATSSLNVRLYSLLGSNAKELTSLENFHGFFNQTWSLAEMRKGIYFLEVTASGRKVVRKIMID